jgi:hypothetical protein
VAFQSVRQRLGKSLFRAAILAALTLLIKLEARAQSEVGLPIHGEIASPADEGYEFVGDESVGAAGTDLEELDAPLDWPNVENAAFLAGSAVNLPAPTTSFWYGGAELTEFKPRYSVNAPAGWFTNGAIGTYTSNAKGAPRLYLGWEHASRFGVRGRVWWFHDEWFAPEWSNNLRRMWNIELTRTDIDLYRCFRFEHGAILLGGNVAVIDLNLDRLPPESPHFQTAGLGLLGEVQHQLYESTNLDVTIIGSGRWTQCFTGKKDYSLNLTNSTYNSSLYVQESRRTTESLLQTAELGAKLEIGRRFGNADLRLSCGVEVQSWNIDPVSELLFFGSTYSATLRY